MKALLPAIKTALQALLLVSSTDIYITPDVKWRPDGTGSPCIGISDNGMSREELAGEMVDISAQVQLSVFAPLVADSKDSLCGTYGLYAVLDAATAILNNNRLSLSDVQRVQIGDDEPSEIYQARENEWLVRITRTIIYNIERSIA